MLRSKPLIFIAGYFAIVVNVSGYVLRPDTAKANSANAESSLPPPSNRIVGGVEIPIDSVPHQVFIETEFECDDQGECEFGYCGGSIIHPRFILTAAHCLHDEMNMTGVNLNGADFRVAGNKSLVRVGSSNSEKEGTNIRGQRNVVHGKFHKKNVDLALIMLERPITWGANGKAPQLISIPTDGDFRNKWDKGLCWISGWGQTQKTSYRASSSELDNGGSGGLKSGVSNSAPRKTERLRQAAIRVMEMDECKQVLGNFTDPLRPGAQRSIRASAANITELNICGYGGNSDTCQGDSGGPVTCFEKKSGKPMLVGTVMDGFGCAAGVPGAYMKAPRLRVWIKQFVKKYLPKHEALAPFA